MLDINLISYFGMAFHGQFCLIEHRNDQLITLLLNILGRLLPVMQPGEYTKTIMGKRLSIQKSHIPHTTNDEHHRNHLSPFVFTALCRQDE